jgi:hypothetical protein
MPPPLNIATDCHAPKCRHLAGNIDSDDANVLAHVDQEFWMIVRSPVVGVVWVVETKLPTSLKQHLAANAVEAAPLAFRRWCDEFVLSHRLVWLTVQMSRARNTRKPLEGVGSI